MDNQKLFDYMMDQHGVTLLVTDMQEIKNLCQEWIPVSKFLPDLEGEYLTYDNVKRAVTVQYFDGRVWGYYASRITDVTHWMELPNLPQP